MLCLDLGCGRTKPPGFIGVDAYHHAAVDQVHDLNVMPWPWKDESVDIVRFSQCLIHLRDMPSALAEALRILKPRGELWIVTGHPSHPEMYTPNHVLPGLTLAGLMPLVKQGPGGMVEPWQGRLELISVALTVEWTWKYPWTWLAAKMAKLSPYGYEHWLAWLAPIRFLEWKGRKQV